MVTSAFKLAIRFIGVKEETVLNIGEGEGTGEAEGEG